MRRSILIPVCLGTLLLTSQFVSAAPLAEEYLTSGKLDEGVAALQKQLQANPQDDQARFGLGVIQFVQSLEHVGNSLYQHGLRTQRAFRGMPRTISEALPQNPSPEPISYADVRKIIQAWVNDIKRAEKTLSEIKDPNVKLPLHVGLIKVDLAGLGKPVDGFFFLGPDPTPEAKQKVSEFVICFDRGDVDWLAGYCNFLCACGEVMLAIDGEEIFNCTAHLFFEKVETPYPFLLEGSRRFDTVYSSSTGVNRPLVSDLLAFIHLWRFELKEPERMQAALAHLEAMQKYSKSMWKFYLAETDDEAEWIPTPQQTGAMQVKISQELLDTWLAVLDETDLVLQGKKLLPFWRGKPGAQGVNLRRVFTEPRTIDPFLWFQGTAAAPYLEEGTITDFATPELLQRIDAAFGDRGFFRIAFWFN